jgi:hypothetical protein
MQTKYSFLVAAVLILASLTVVSIGISMKAYAQNTTQTADTAAGQTTNMTNMTGLAAGPVENDDAAEGEEEGPGEDEDEPGDVDTNDKED